MATAYPAAIDSFVAKQDNVDDVEAVNVNDLQEAIEALETKVGVTSSAVTASIDYKVNNFFATGRKVYLYENTAPTGWSITAVTDKVLAVKGGSGTYNTTGGTAAGTFDHTHADTLAAPAHTHAITAYSHYRTNETLTGGSVDYAVGDGDANHDHGGNTQAATATALTGSITSTSGYRPAAAIGIICTKA